MLRIPEEEHEELVAWSKEEGRSLHSLLMWIIRRALKEWRK
jgi:predicted HicB family RNase H-like nuclease